MSLLDQLEEIYIDITNILLRIETLTESRSPDKGHDEYLNTMIKQLKELTLTSQNEVKRLKREIKK